MNKALPKDFIESRKPLLGDQWDAFLDSFHAPRSYGLRLNPLKDCSGLPFKLKQVPWTKEGFYADPEEHPGKHPLHEAGAYYIQEPSAMSVVSLLEPLPGELVCDLCAAPGGKSTQIAGRLQGQGLLVSNEIFPNRAKILSQNIERLGITNALVCNEPPDHMASLFPLYFDRIVVDAPCSGEGMFRKDETAIKEWSLENIRTCVSRQRMILDCADEMLNPGGVMVYSTCTFAPEEDETMIAWFLSTHPDYILEDWKETEIGKSVSQFQDNAGLCNGFPQWVDWDALRQECEEADGKIPDNLPDDLKKTLRLWPHKLRGEGHFAARLRKTGIPFPSFTEISAWPEKNGSKKRSSKKNRSGRDTAKRNILTNAVSGYESFQKDYLTSSPVSILKTGLESINSCFELFGDELYQLPSPAPSLEGIKILRAGLHLGTNKKNRFEPSYALAKALTKSQARYVHDCTQEDAVRYLKGETLSCNSDLKGWILVCYQNYPLGWGKAQNGLLKNHFPKGLRWI